MLLLVLSQKKKMPCFLVGGCVCVCVCVNSLGAFGKVAIALHWLSCALFGWNYRGACGAVLNCFLSCLFFLGKMNGD